MCNSVQLPSVPCNHFMQQSSHQFLQGTNQCKFIYLLPAPS